MSHEVRFTKYARPSTRETKGMQDKVQRCIEGSDGTCAGFARRKSRDMAHFQNVWHAFNLDSSKVGGLRRVGIWHIHIDRHYTHSRDSLSHFLDRLHSTGRQIDRHMEHTDGTHGHGWATRQAVSTHLFRSQGSRSDD